VWEFGATPRAVFRAEVPTGSVATVADLTVGVGLLAVGNDRGTVHLWSFFGHGPHHQIETGLAAPVRQLCFSDDGTWVATEAAGHAVGVWEVGDAKVRHTVPGHGEGTWHLRFLAGHDRVVTAGRGSSIKVWNVTSEREELALFGHVGRVTALAVSPDGRTLVSGSGTGEVKLWDLRTGLELVGLRRHTGAVTTAEFGANGQTLLTGGTAGGGRGELAFWDTEQE
jgi:WD40 repeat protein